MAYRLEANPELLDPQRWGGIDITNPQDFTPRGDDHLMTSAEQRQAAELLTPVVAAVHANTYRDPVADLRDDGTLDTDRLSNGSVLILDRESLIHWDGDDELARVLDTDMGGGAAIAGRHADYWQEHQGRRKSEGFGVEQAVFLDENAVYTRYLEWGVLLKEGITSILALWSLSDINVRRGVMRLPLGPITSEDSLTLPIKVARSSAHSELFNGAYVRRIQRVRAARVIYPHEGGVRDWGGRGKFSLGFARRPAITRPAVNLATLPVGRS